MQQRTNNSSLLNCVNELVLWMVVKVEVLAALKPNQKFDSAKEWLECSKIRVISN